MSMRTAPVTRIARQTKLPVTVIHADDAGLDDSGGDTQWYTICEAHHQCTGHRSYRDAVSWSAAPVTWCDVCSDNSIR